MPKIEWNKAFSVKNAEIDHQHKKWFEIYNNLRQDMIRYNEHSTHSFVVQSLKEMEAYTKKHFAFEENHMKEIRYPDVAEHIKEHEKFDQKITEFHQNMEQGQMVLNSDVLDSIKIWLLEHVIKEDIKYSNFSSP